MGRHHGGTEPREARGENRVSGSLRKTCTMSVFIIHPTQSPVFLVPDRFKAIVLCDSVIDRRWNGIQTKNRKYVRSPSQTNALVYSRIYIHGRRLPVAIYFWSIAQQLVTKLHCGRSWEGDCRMEHPCLGVCLCVVDKVEALTVLLVVKTHVTSKGASLAARSESRAHSDPAATPEPTTSFNFRFSAAFKSSRINGNLAQSSRPKSAMACMMWLSSRGQSTCLFSV